MAKFNFSGRKVYSRNFWDEGRTAQAKNWRIALAKQEREAMKWEFVEKMQKGFIPPPPYIIKLIRKYPTKPSNPLYKPQRRYDDDDMNGGCKHLRDGIADGLGLKSDKGITWEYDQVKTKNKQELTVIIKTRE